MTTIPAGDLASSRSAVRPRIGWPTKTLYGLGAMATSIKSRGLSSFLLIFYNQVIGLPPQLVSMAIAAALVFDAIIDPVVGQISDNFRSPWGRRHPFMYAAAIPVAVAFFLIWNPPDWEPMAVFGYMLACLLTIRLFDTFFELPSTALAPELTDDYDQRTALIGMRTLFVVIGGLIMTILAYQVFLKENPDGTGGVLAREGYFDYALASAIVIALAIIISTAGTHRQIPWLRQPAKRRLTLPVMLREMGQTVNNGAFLAVSAAGMCAAIATSAKTALELYFGLYFWGFTQSQLSLITVAGIIAGVAGVSLAPIATRMLGKKKAAMILFALGIIIGAGPIVLRLMHLMPPNGTPLLFWILFVDIAVSQALGITMIVLLGSMMADVVEDVEVKTGRRSEGLLFSADNLFKKMVSAAGPLIAGQMLAWVHFPKNARRDGVDPQVLHDLALVYLPTVATLFAGAILFLAFFKIDRAQHDENLRKLKEIALAREAEAIAEEPPFQGSKP